MTSPDRSAGKVRFGLPGRDTDGPPPFGRAGVLTGLVLVVVIVGSLVWAAASGSPVAAQRPRLFAGSLLLQDSRAPTVVDLATAKVTVRLPTVDAQVGARNDGSVEPVPVAGGTVLVNEDDGAFNYLDADDYVADPGGAGVGLGTTPSFGARGYAAGADAYIVRTTGSSSVSLVGRATVLEAAKASTSSAGATGSGHSVTAGPAAAVSPLGYSALDGVVSSLQPGAAVVSGTDLWSLVGQAAGCRVEQLTPVATSRQGLVDTTRARSAAPCGSLALEAGSAEVGLAGPGQVEIFSPSVPEGSGTDAPVRIATPFTSSAHELLPVQGAGPVLWFLAGTGSQWQLFGVNPSRSVSGPYQLSSLSGANPAEPVLADGVLYTLDLNAQRDATLWTIEVANGRMAPLVGQATYPRLRLENADFSGAQVVLDGPRVVFNNPQSLEAVVVFTDGSHPPAVVNKTQAVTVSATGPADLNAKTAPTTPGSKGKNGGSGSTGGYKSPVPAVQAVSQQVTCANTTQKPYAPQITGVSPSSGSALIEWSYQLLDQTDCEPSSWSVRVTALTGGHQPDQPLQIVYGQDQYLFQGLRPTTTYEVVVTAYINRQSTASNAATFTTTARGPDAPVSVHTAADGNGNWVVSWTPCTELVNKNCIVPAAQWSVVGAACGGSFVGTPPSVLVPGGQDSVTISAASAQLLGDSLSFSVQGSLASGLTGDPTSDHSCTEAYGKPDAGAITVTGEGQAVSSTDSITATLTVQASGDPESVFGVPARNAEFVYTLAGTSPPRTVGPVSQTSVTISGLPAGVSFTPSVEIYPAGHPDAAVTIHGSAFSQTLSWPPDLSAGGTQAVGTVNPDWNTGSVTVNLPADVPSGVVAIAPTAANSPGSGPEVQCGGPGGMIPASAPQTVGASRQITLPMDLVQQGGDCIVSFGLVDPAQPDPYGGPSPDITVGFAIGTQAPYAFSYDFANCQNYDCGPLGPKSYTVEVDSVDQPFSFAGGDDWTVTVSDPASLCSVTGSESTPPTFPFDVELPKACFDPGQVSVSVSWTYLGQHESVPASRGNAPPPPATTTTSTTSTSTTTTTVPCPSTTTTTTDCGQTTTTSQGGAGAAAASRSAATALAAVRSEAVPGRPDEGARWAVGVLLVAVLGLAVGSPLLGGRNRRNPEKRNR